MAPGPPASSTNRSSPGRAGCRSGRPSVSAWRSSSCSRSTTRSGCRSSRRTICAAGTLSSGCRAVARARSSAPAAGVTVVAARRARRVVRERPPNAAALHVAGLVPRLPRARGRRLPLRARQGGRAMPTPRAWLVAFLIAVAVEAPIVLALTRASACVPREGWCSSSSPSSRRTRWSGSCSRASPASRAGRPPRCRSSGPG